MTINWQEVAMKNNLTPEEFTNEILACACAVGMIDAESRNNNRLVYSANDGHGMIEMTITRVGDE
jgi:hypothetical protein